MAASQLTSLSTSRGNGVQKMTAPAELGGEGPLRFPAAESGGGSGAGRPGGILGERWPTLARALSRYEQETAERFSRLAYEAVSEGIIRYSDRQRLGREAEEAGIRPFDAQLLIACAIRQWAMDHQYDSSPSPTAPALSFEYKSWHRVWLRLAIVAVMAVGIDAVIIFKWLH